MTFTMVFRKALILVSATLAVLPAVPIRANELPLGDGRISSVPRTGFLMSCTTHWRRGPTHSGPWIQGESWDPAAKPAVEGSVTWSAHRISITTRGNERIISANNLPDHPTGVFPISSSDPAYSYDRNPNAIRPQHVLLRLPLNPVAAATPTCVPMGMVGFTVDGVAIYNAVDDGGTDAVAHEVQDRCGGHPQHNGQYHYHGPSPCMPNEMTSGLVGYALDGFGIYGMKDRATGRVLRDSDLDACHGIISPVMWDGKLVNMYHYVLTSEYPYTIGCFRGTPTMTNLTHGQSRRMMPAPPGAGAAAGWGDQASPPRRAGGGGRASDDRGPRDGARPGGGNRERLMRAARVLGISPRTLREALGPPPPDLRAAAEKLGISVETLQSALGPRRPDADN